MGKDRSQKAVMMDGHCKDVETTVQKQNKVTYVLEGMRSILTHALNDENLRLVVMVKRKEVKTAMMDQMMESDVISDAIPAQLPGINVLVEHLPVLQFVSQSAEMDYE